MYYRVLFSIPCANVDKSEEIANPCQSFEIYEAPRKYPIKEQKPEWNNISSLFCMFWTL